MKKLEILIGLCLCLSCSLSMDTEDEGLCDSVFSIRGTTKVTGASDASETNVQRWAVMLFDAGNPAAWYYATSDGSADITCTVRKGRPYRAYAIVNYPPDFSPSLIQGEGHLLQFSSTLSSNTDNALVMFGSKQLPVLPSGTTSIPLQRLCSKVAINKISVSMEDPVYAAQEFTLNALYLTNVYTCTSFVCDHYEPDSDPNLWYNARGWHGSGNVRTLDNLVGDRGLGVSIGNGNSYQTQHVFYAYPNACEEDSTDEHWSPRHTRLVIEATLGARRYYYTITLPAMIRNNCYTINEASIRKPGSLDPEMIIPGIVDAVVTITEDTWDSEYYTSEES